MHSRNVADGQARSAAMDILEAFDLGTLYWFGSQHRPWLDRSLGFVTHFGDFPVLAVVVLLGLAAFLRARRPATAAVFLGTVLAAWGVEKGTKWVVSRPRPEVAW